MDLPRNCFSIQPGKLPCQIIQLPWAWRIRWEDTAGNVHVSRVLGPCEEHIAHLMVATHNSDLYYEIVDSRKVIVT